MARSSFTYSGVSAPKLILTMFIIVAISLSIATFFIHANASAAASPNIRVEALINKNDSGNDSGGGVVDVDGGVVDVDGGVDDFDDNDIPDSVQLTINIPTKDLRDSSHYSHQLGDENLNIFDHMFEGMMKILESEMDIDSKPNAFSDGNEDERKKGEENEENEENEEKKVGGKKKTTDLFDDVEYVSEDFTSSPFDLLPILMGSFDAFAPSSSSSSSSSSFSSFSSSGALRGSSADKSLNDFDLDDEGKAIAALSPPLSHPHSSMSPFTSFMNPLVTDMMTMMMFGDDGLSNIINQTSNATDIAFKGPTVRTEILDDENVCKISVGISKIPKNSFVQIEVDDNGWVTLDYVNELVSTNEDDGGHHRGNHSHVADADGDDITTVSSSRSASSSDPSSSDPSTSDPSLSSGAVDDEVDDAQFPAWSSFSSIISRVETTRKFMLDERCDVTSDEAKATVDENNKIALMRFPLKKLENDEKKISDDEQKRKDEEGDEKIGGDEIEEKNEVIEEKSAITAQERMLEKKNSISHILRMVPLEEF